MDEKLIAFTFDDAPTYEDLGDNPTTVIMDVLNHFGGKGTFFIIGKRLRSNGRKLVDKMVEYGFEIANHTDTHAKLTELSEDEIKTEIMALQEMVINEFGIEMKYFRPAGLNVDAKVYSVTSQLNMPVIFGSHGDANLIDWNLQTTPEYIKKHCLDNVYPGQIILMHGYSKGTAAVFNEICETLMKEGYRFVTLSELFEAYGVKELPCNRPIIDAQLTEI